MGASRADMLEQRGGMLLTGIVGGRNLGGFVFSGPIESPEVAGDTNGAAVLYGALWR